MPPKKRNRRTKKSNKRHLPFIFFLIAVAIFVYFEESGKQKRPIEEEAPAGRQESFGPGKEPGTVVDIPDLPSPGTLPRVAIIMDDLGPNKEMAQRVLDLDAPLTLAILPREVYSKWIAEEGHRRGHDIMLHIPMEATRPLPLGKGGLYTSMRDREIRKTLNGDIDSVPHTIGASNHMGSAFTQDKKAMSTVLSVLKERRLFFLDSLTIPDAVGYDLGKEQGVAVFRRDVFLDNDNAVREIAKQWDRMVKIAKEKGRAIAQGHPRENTISFLKEALSRNEVEVVPISELTAAPTS